MKGHTADLSAATYRLYDETHTIGNSLRWMLMKKWVTNWVLCEDSKLIVCFFVCVARFSPKVEYCGYRWVLLLVLPFYIKMGKGGVELAYSCYIFLRVFDWLLSISTIPTLPFSLSDEQSLFKLLPFSFLPLFHPASSTVN